MFTNNYLYSGRNTKSVKPYNSLSTVFFCSNTCWLYFVSDEELQESPLLKPKKKRGRRKKKPEAVSKHANNNTVDIFRNLNVCDIVIVFN